MSASVVLGQSSFTTTNTGATAYALNSPRGVAVDPQDHILVADPGNARVQIFDVAANLTTGDPCQPGSELRGLSQPTAIAMGSNGEFWIADPAQNELFHYPTVGNLPIKNYTADATQPANSPRAAFLDQYNNLLVADGIDRLLYSVPQVSVVNAANFIPGRPLAPGTYAAIFPTVAGNPLTPTTQSLTASTLPFPATLGDTQVVVNGTPSPRYFVSQGQINTPLSLSLPTGGNVNLQVVRQSTGQIFGAAELALSSASPGLFTDGSTSTGQVAAINAVDGSVNTATNPVIRGQYIELYGTGQGYVAGGPPDGQASSGLVPTRTDSPDTAGKFRQRRFHSGRQHNVFRAGSTLVDVWQINIQVPATAQSGTNVPITVFMNNIPNTNPSNPTQIVTTISIK